MRDLVGKYIIGGLDLGVRILARTGISEDFIRFGIVGTLGFCWDTGTVYALKGMTGLYVAGFVSYFVASTANWGLNRVWTFRHREHDAAHVQWAKFFAANLIGFAFNRGTYFTLISISRLCHSEPVLAIIAGSAGGLCFNYFLSKRFVFS
jgi:putative flippase GtrA